MGGPLGTSITVAESPACEKGAPMCSCLGACCCEGRESSWQWDSGVGGRRCDGCGGGGGVRAGGGGARAGGRGGGGLTPAPGALGELYLGSFLSCGPRAAMEGVMRSRAR